MALMIDSCFPQHDDSLGFYEAKHLEHELNHQPLKTYLLTPRFLEVIKKIQQRRKMSDEELINLKQDFCENDYEKIDRHKKEKLEYFIDEFCKKDKLARNLNVKESASLLGYAGSLIVNSDEKLKEEDFQFFDINCLEFYKRFLDFMERTQYRGIEF